MQHPKSFERELRTRLLVIALAIALLLTLVDIFYSYFSALRGANELLATESGWASQLVDEKLVALRKVVNTTAILPWGDESPYTSTNYAAEAGKLLRGSADFHAAGFFSSDGAPLTVVRQGVLDSGAALVIPTRQQLTATGTRLGEPRVLARQQLSEMIHVIPVVAMTTDANRLFAGFIRVQTLSDVLAQSNRTSAGRTFLFDHRGTILAHSVAAWNGVRIDLASIEPGTGGQSLKGWQHGLVGDYVLRAVKNVPNSDLRVGVEYPLELLRGRLAEVVVRASVLLSLSVLLAWALSRWIAQRTALPIVQIAKATRRLAEGERQVVVRVDAPSEIRELAESFNEMSISLSKSQSTLESRVEEQTRSLASANAELAFASQHKSQFLAHMSHELRTPLNAVIGFSDLLKAQYFGALNEKQTEYVRDINASGQHLLSLINDILDLAKVEAGRMELVRSDVHLPSVVEACCSLVSERFARKSQTLDAVVDPAVSFWSLDERKVKQCVLNLLSNANKFTPNGGRVSLSVAVEVGALVVRVTDTGVGIAPDAVSQLFTEFYQVAPSSAAAGGAAAAQSTEAREGTGLGLSLTKKFVELHGGTVEVASEVGNGSTFTLRFPAVATADAETAVLS